MSGRKCAATASNAPGWYVPQRTAPSAPRLIATGRSTRHTGVRRAGGVSPGKGVSCTGTPGAGCPVEAGWERGRAGASMRQER